MRARPLTAPKVVMKSRKALRPSSARASPPGGRGVSSRPSGLSPPSARAAPNALIGSQLTGASLLPLPLLLLLLLLGPGSTAAPCAASPAAGCWPCCCSLGCCFVPPEPAIWEKMMG
jgi:hypothetical protein